MRKRQSGTNLLSNQNLLVVIGTSAGGLPILEALLGKLEAQSPKIDFIIAQHQSPDQDSYLTRLLSLNKKLAIQTASDGDVLDGGRIYITPPGKDLVVTEGKISLQQTSSLYRPSIDRLFDSAALQWGQRAVGVILSGKGADGVKGLEAIKRCGGFTIALDPGASTFNGMPTAAIEAKAADVVAKPEEIIPVIEQYALHGTYDHFSPEIEPHTADLLQVLKKVAEHSGTNFINYKANTIRRRVERRMALAKVSSMESYLEIIHKDKDETEALYRDLLISVTSFFRDKTAFNFLQKKLGEYLKGKKAGDEIRVWVPACASGEEVYTIAIILHELLGEKAQQYKVQIFGSDISKTALQTARKGVYPEQALKGMSRKMVARYFDPAGEGFFQVGKKLKSVVLFSLHDLTSAPPFAKLDLVSCRNIFIYFERELQKKVLRSFHYALHPDGWLLLGKSENIEKGNALFLPVSSTHKLYARSVSEGARKLDFIPIMRKIPVPDLIPNRETVVEQALKQYFLSTYTHPYVVVDQQLQIKRVSRNISPFVSFAEGDLSLNLVRNAHPELQVELRSVFLKLVKYGKKVSGVPRVVKMGNRSMLLTINAEVLLDNDIAEKLFIVSFVQDAVPRTLPKVARQASGTPDGRVRQLEQELSLARQQLQAIIEELESANEELQSLNEELQSANEELQASNEEMETSNEELQSANEEMIVAYNELQEVYRLLEEKEDLVRLTSNKIQTILENTQQGYILVNRQYRVLTMNKTAEDIIVQLTGKELAGEATIFNCAPLQSLNSFKENLDKAFNGETTQFKTEEQRGDDTTWLRFNYAPVYGAGDKIEAVLISYIDLTAEVKLRKMVELKEANLNSVVDNFDGYVWSMDRDRRYITFNSRLKEKARELLGVELKAGEKVRGVLESMDLGASRVWMQLYKDGFEGKPRKLVHEFRVNREPCYFEVSVTPISKDGEVIGLTCFSRDISVQVRERNEAGRIEKRYRSLIENSHDGVALVNGEWKFMYLTPSVGRILGYSIDDLLDTDILQLAHADDLKYFQAELKSLMPRRRQTVKVQYRMKHKNGAWKWLSFNITNMFHDPAVNALVLNYEDITQRMVAEEKLLHKSEQLASSQKLAKVGSWEFTLEDLEDLDNKPITWSEECYKIFGMKPGEALITCGFFFGMVYEEDRSKISDAVKQCVRQHSEVDVQYRIKLKDGSTRHIYDRLNLALSSKGKTMKVAGACQDITELKNKEIRIIQSEANLRAIFNNTVTGFQLFDTSFTLVAFNHLAYEWTLQETGKKLEEGRHFSDYIGEEKQPFFEKQYRDAMSGNEVTFEYRGTKTERHFKVVIKGIFDAQGSCIGICISTADVTEQKLAEQAIRDSESLYRYLFNNSPLAKWVCEKETLRVMEVNDRALDIYGYTRKEFLNMSAYNIRVEDEHNILEEVRKSGGEVLKHKMATHRKKNGDLLFVTVSLHEIHYKGSVAYLVLANDVTETLNLQKQLSEEKVNKQIEVTRASIHAQEIERAELGKELHDNVNQMLASVKLYLDSALLDEASGPQFIRKGQTQVVRCIEELRRISKTLVPPSLGDLTLKEAMEEIVLPLRISGKSVTLKVLGLRENLLKDELKISVYRIVQEQLNNIIKYAEASQITIILQQKSSMLSLKIADNGKGFDVTKKRSGIGINNMTNRANTYRGTLAIRSEPGKGCELSVVFDLV
jgi:PAS domain S-box-containing protein